MVSITKRSPSGSIFPVYVNTPLKIQKNSKKSKKSKNSKNSDLLFPFTGYRCLAHIAY